MKNKFTKQEEELINYIDRIEFLLIEKEMIMNETTDRSIEDIIRNRDDIVRVHKEIRDSKKELMKWFRKQIKKSEIV